MDRKLEDDIKDIVRNHELDGIIIMGLKKEKGEVVCSVVGDMCELAQMMKFAVDENVPLKEVFNHAAQHSLREFLEDTKLHNQIRLGKVARA